tara:strand:- start:3789 stop:4034 length:246 start_codon:yes stop_codon:yes gene_type:complete
MEWINVNEQLPKNNGFYNVEIETEERNIIHSCWFEDGIWKYDNLLDIGDALYSTGWFAQVVFWQPLPTRHVETWITKDYLR